MIGEAMSRGGLLLCALLFTQSCSTTDRVIASPEDYQHYREIRLEHGFLGRLSAAWRYLDTEPHGAFREEVERWFHRADERFLLRHWDDLSNLQRYTAALPDAPRSGLAAARIAALRALSDRVAREEAAFLAREAERQKELDAAKEGRGAFIRTLLGWVELQVSSSDYGKPEAAWSPELRSVYFAEQAPASCSPTSCRKQFLASFEIPRQHGLETRAVSFQLTAHVERGKLRALELAGVGLFDRLAEAATARPSDPGDLQARAESIGVAAQLLSLTLAAGFGSPECEREAVSPVVLWKACDGRSARMIAAETESDEDRVVVSIE